MAKQFFNKINYSACNEDSESERRALQLSGYDTILCITGSGSRPLDLLIDKPKRIISVDFNPTQNYLLELKICAYQHLNYREFRSIMGIDELGNRKAIFEKLKLHLSNEARIFWSTNFDAISSGLLYCGTWERLQQFMVRLAVFRRKKIKKLMSFDLVKDQADFWDKKWDNWIWRFFLRFLSNRFLWTKIIKEPGALLIPEDFNVFDYMYSRLNHLAHHQLLKTNHFAHLMFFGKYKEECILPIHLREENFELLKSQIHKIEIHTDSLIQILNNQNLIRGVTSYSLSDFSSYANPDMYDEIWKTLVRNASSNSKVCERHFLVKRSVPISLKSKCEVDSELEEVLYNNDLTSLYSFRVVKIL